VLAPEQRVLQQNPSTPAICCATTQHWWGGKMLVYEDNFGFWDIGGREEQAFFDHLQRHSVLIACQRCERQNRLIPPKAFCASCVSALEHGAPISMKEYGCSQKPLLDPTHPP
jgi:hypothetical protein